jgi:hypothetical protein
MAIGLFVNAVVLTPTPVGAVTVRSLLVMLNVQIDDPCILAPIVSVASA